MSKNFICLSKTKIQSLVCIIEHEITETFKTFSFEDIKNLLFLSVFIFCIYPALYPVLFSTPIGKLFSRSSSCSQRISAFLRVLFPDGNSNFC